TFRFVAEWKSGASQVLDRTTIRLGRKDVCQIQLNDPAVSLIHAELERRPDGVWISDESTGAGVYINGSRIGKQEWRDGDVIKIGRFEMAVRFSEQACTLGITEPVPKAQATPEALPAYRGVVSAPAARSAGEEKPSAAVAALPKWMQAKAPIW